MTNYHKFDADHVLDACRQCGEWANHDSHNTKLKKSIVLDAWDLARQRTAYQKAQIWPDNGQLIRKRKNLLMPTKSMTHVPIAQVSIFGKSLPLWLIQMPASKK